MKHLIALLIVGIAITGVSFGAADAAAKKGAIKSLDPTKGYFHQLHVQKMTMTCATCHSSETRDTSISSTSGPAKRNASRKIAAVNRAVASSTRAVLRRSLIALQTRSMPTWTWLLSISLAELNPKEMAYSFASRMRFRPECRFSQL